ncbi:MAG: hypothetical protein ACRDOZ_12005, partial [Nocardioides sp.]
LWWTVPMSESLLEMVPGVHPVFEHVDVQRLEVILEELAGIIGDPERVGPMADCHRIDLIDRLERIKAATAAAQARVTVAFEASQLVRQESAGVRREERGRGIGDRVALARGCPASQGSRHLGFAKAMAEMPHTFALLTRGQVDEWTATVLVRETAVLAREDRREVDQRLWAMTVDQHTGLIEQPWVLLRQLFTDPATGVVTAIDPRRRRFHPRDSRFIGLRDQHCRHPRCDGAIADYDHVVRAADRGSATRTNGQGLCEAHNLLKEIPGWSARVADPRPRHHTVEITTPTGHTYRSQAPPGLPPPV